MYCCHELMRTRLENLTLPFYVVTVVGKAFVIF